MEAALLVEALCNLQPLHVRDRLLRDETWGTRFRLAPPIVITIGRDMPAEQQNLFIAARRMLAGQGVESFIGADGCHFSHYVAGIFTQYLA